MIRPSEITESFRMAFDSLRVNVLRSVLTTSGVVVGVVLVVLMGWTINGLNAIWEQTISILGKDMLYIDKWDWTGGGKWQNMASRKDITLEQITALSNRLESPELVVPTARSWGGTMVYGSQSLRCSINGTTAQYGSTPAADLTDGRFFNAVEELQGSNVVVIGYGIAKNLFPRGNAIGSVVKINEMPFRIIGVIERRAVLFLDFIDNQAFIPLSAYRAVYGLSGHSLSASIKAGNEKMLDVVRDEAIGAMRAIRNVPPGSADDFSINEMKAFDAQATKIRLGIWFAGIGLTLLAFLVGSIGIMNIMFVSVTERTKEIGVRKAIGARKGTILMQFLIESSMLCLAGAFIAFPISQLLAGAARWIAIGAFEFEAAEVISPFIQLELLGIATIVSIVVGILAGLAPAIRASRLNPVDAMRFE